MEDRIAEELEGLKKEVREIKSVIAGLFDRGNLNQKMAEGVVTLVSCSSGQVLGKNLISSCPLNSECFKAFSDFLDKALRDGLKSQELETLYREKKESLSHLEKNAPYSQCSSCFSEVLELVNRQHRVLEVFKGAWESLNFGIEREFRPGEIMEGLRPVSNEVRLTVLKELHTQPRRFTYLSNATGMEGGNLRFHLNQLVSAGLVGQEKRGGKYLLTEKGRIIFEQLSRVFQGFKHAEVTLGSSAK